MIVMRAESWSVTTCNGEVAGSNPVSSFTCGKGL